MFTTAERETFARRGLIKRQNFLPAEKVTNARKVIFRHLEQAGLWRNGDWVQGEGAPATELTAGMALVKPLNHHQAIIDLTSDEAPTAVSALVDGRLLCPMDRHPALLFTLPNATVFHTIAPNARQIPRIMLTQRYLLESARIALYGKA